MEIFVGSNRICYDQLGEGKDIIMLHGWGQNKEMMLPLAKRFEKNYRITIIDLPGFGLSSEPISSLNIYEYADIVKKIVDTLKIKKPILIGHSFGGRISIVYASKYDVEKVVLFGAPCIRNRKPSKREKLLKTLKKIPGTKQIVAIAKNYIGSTDYKNASPIMRETLVKTINQDLSNEAKAIKVPTLLIWGTKDTAAPISAAKELQKLISDSALIEIPNLTHYAYLEGIDYVTRILNSFLGGKK